MSNIKEIIYKKKHAVVVNRKVEIVIFHFTIMTNFVFFSFKILVNNLFKETFYEKKKKKINILTTFFILISKLS